MAYYMESKRSVKIVHHLVSEDTLVYRSRVVETELDEFTENIFEDEENIMEEEENLLSDYSDRSSSGEESCLLEEEIVTLDDSSDERVQMEEDMVTLDVSLTEQMGYSWGTESKYWVMWTMWEHSVFEGLKPLAKLWHDEAHNMKMEEFNSIINKGFLSISSDPSFQTLKTGTEMRRIVIRLDYEINKEPFKILSETVEMNALEMMFSRSISFRFQPITLIACAGLAEILRAVCKDADFLIISGTYKRMFTPKGKCVLLLNFDNSDGRLQILRLSFSDLKAPIYMVEKIKPMAVEKRFQFRYFVRGTDNKTRKDFGRHQDFIQRTKKCTSMQEFPIPIQHDEDPVQVYYLLLFNAPFQLAAPNARQFSPVNNQEQNKSGKRQYSCSDQSREQMRDSTVFFSRRKPSPTTPSPRIFSRRAVPSEDIRPGMNRKLRRSQSPADICDHNPLGHRTKFFEIFGKISVCIVFGLFCLVVFLVLYTPPKCSNKPLLIEPKDSKENGFENRVSYIFVKCRSILQLIGLWIQENCGWNCLMERIGISVVNKGPIV